MPVDPRDPAAIRTPSRGRCFLYVAPCLLEDLLKLGFSREPLQRFQALHRRWFELFDTQGIMLVEADSVRDARAMEARLRRELSEYNSNVPLTVREEAGGAREWYRGASDHLVRAVEELRQQGHAVHAPATAWLRDALLARAELLYAWTGAMLSVDEIELRAGITPAQRAVRDALDAYAALGVDPSQWLPENVQHWYRAGGGL